MAKVICNNCGKKVNDQDFQDHALACVPFRPEPGESFAAYQARVEAHKKAEQAKKDKDALKTPNEKILATTVTNSSLRKFNVVLVPPGAKYGLNDCLTNISGKPLVEFYDATHENKEGFGPLGQFVSRYFLETLIEDGPRLVRNGLDLHGDVSEWKLDSAAIGEALFAVIKRVI